MSEIFPEKPITSLPEAVAFMGALPMKVGPHLSELERMRLRVDEVERAYTFDTAALKRRIAELEHTVQGMVEGLNGHDCPPPNEAPLETVTRWMGYLDTAEARVAELEAERHETNEALDDAVQEPRARRVLDPAEYGRVWSLIPDRTDRERVDAVLASIGLLTPPPPSEPGTCVAWFWDGSGWWQCAESTDHDPREGHGNGEGLSWADGVEYAGFPCPCPPADQPGPHQVGCPLAEVPRLSERPVNELTAVYMPVAAYREDPHDSPLYHDYKGPGRDFPELGGAS